MIVDDLPDNLQLLRRMLQDCGCEVIAFPDGAMALKAAYRRAPDLVLLDVNMPGMNGYEVCQGLKGHPSTQGVPVIFLSALNATEDKVKAFTYGGEDFITKPFFFEEVKARVEVHLKIHQYRRELEEKNQALEISLQDLAKVAATRDTLVHMVVHDMRNLMQSSLMNLQLLSKMRPDQFGVEGPLAVQDALASAFLLREMISTVLDLSKMESGAMELQVKPCDLRTIAKSALEPLRALQEAGHLVLHLPPEAIPVVCDPPIVGRILLNLVSNAVKFTPPLPGGIQVILQQSEEGARLAVRDLGTGIAPEHHEQIFERYNQGAGPGSERHQSSGLGLAFAKLAVEAHGGSIGVESELGYGSTFWFTLPR
jgi:two-component system, sensor histidine kinase and response regulator